VKITEYDRLPEPTFRETGIPFLPLKEEGLLLAAVHEREGCHTDHLMYSGGLVDGRLEKVGHFRNFCRLLKGAISHSI
jgi:hypothetical protein